MNIDLKRKMVDIGRYRYRFMKIDMKPWLDKVCPICEKSFTEEPHYYYMSTPIHNDCTSTEKFSDWMAQQYSSWETQEDEGEYNVQ